jgi:putative transposase
MPRRSRHSLQAPNFHVLNRSVRKAPLFTRPQDYRAFLGVLGEGLKRHPVRLVAYCVLPNHWHLVVRPPGTNVLARFVQWVTATHATRWHMHRNTVGQGPVYQGRYHSMPLAGPGDLIRVCRYVERNALRAKLVKRAEDWPWCSLSERFRAQPQLPLLEAPFLMSAAWVDYVNAIATVREQFEADDQLFVDSYGTEPMEIVENSSDPLDANALHDPAELPSLGELGAERGDVVGRTDQDEANAHIKRPKHFVVRHSARALKPRKEWRNTPAVSVE